MAGHFRRVEVWSDLQCAGGVRLAVLRDPLVLEPTYDLTGDESLKLGLSRASASYAKLAERRALRIVRRAGGVESWEEWRLSARGESSGFTSPPSDFTGRPVRFDLGDVILRRTLDDGTTAFSFSFTGLTLAEAFDAYIAPALAASGFGYWGRGTFDSSAPFDDNIIDGTALSILRKWADRFELELAERRNGTTGYLIDLLEERGANAPTPRVETRKNLELTKRTITTNEQATRVIPRGGEAGTEKVGIGAIRWKVAGVDSVTKRLTIVDELGIVTPIAFDDQLNGWFVFREETGATFAIVDTLQSTQQLELSDVSTFSTGELISLRVADPNTNTLNWRPMVSGVAPLLYAAAVDIAGLRVTLANSVPSVGGAGAFITADGDMVDWTAVFCPLVLKSIGSASANVAGYYEVDPAVDPAADLSLVQVGDIVWIDADSAPVPSFAAAPPYPIGTVTDVDAGLNRLTVENRYDPLTPAIASTSAAGYTLRVYRPTYSRLIRLSIAASNEIELTDISSLALDQMVEVRQTAGGVLPIALEAPAEIQALTSTPAGYGVVERFVDVPTVRGETNLIPNPFMRDWTGSTSAAPDQWALADGATILQETDPELATLGGKSGLVDFGTLLSPAFRVWRIGTSVRTTVSLRVRLQFSAFAGSCGLALTIENTAGTPSTKILRTLYPENHPTAADVDKFETDVWYDIIITAINLAALDLNNPLQLRLAKVGGAAGDVCTAYVDAAQVTQTNYDPGAFIEGSGATQLWNVGNRFLDENSAPLIEYAVELRDLSRLDGSPWTADAIEIGQTMQLRDRDLNIVATPRVVQYAPNDLDPLSSRVVLSNRRKTLARLLSRLAALAENGAGARSSTPAIPSISDVTPGDGTGSGSDTGKGGILHVPFFDLLTRSGEGPIGALKNIPVLSAEISPWIRKRVPLAGMSSARLVGYVEDAADVSTAGVELAYSIDNGVNFIPLPSPMTLATTENVESDWDALPSNAQNDILITARALGGDGTTIAKLTSLAAQFAGSGLAGGGTAPDDVVASVEITPAFLNLNAADGPWDDPFDFGTELDTLGVRFGGAKPWTKYNTGVSFSGDDIVADEWRMVVSTNGGFWQPYGATEDLPASGDWEFELTDARMSYGVFFEEFIGIILVESSTGKENAIGVGANFSGPGGSFDQCMYVRGSSGIYLRSPLGGLTAPGTDPFVSQYLVSLRVEKTGSTIQYKYLSWVGSPNWINFYGQTITTPFTTAPDKIGLVMCPGVNASGPRTAYFGDWKRVS